MDGLPLKEGHHCAAPMCLLYVNGSNQLVSIAIQLKQQPGETNPIFLSTDNWIDWLLAKIYYQSAQTQVYSIVYSSGNCVNALKLSIHGRILPECTNSGILDCIQLRQFYSCS